MGFVCPLIGQSHLERRCQFNVHRHVTQIAQLHLPELNVVFRADPHTGMGLQVAPLRIETHPIRVKHALVVRFSVRGGMLRDGDGL